MTNKKSNGWIKLHRSIEDWPLYFHEPFTKAQAWIDMLLLANHADGVINIRGNIVQVKRGQIGWGEESLGDRWKWSRSKVRRFFSYLETIQQIFRASRASKKDHLTCKKDETDFVAKSVEKEAKTIQQTIQQNLACISLITIVNYDKYQKNDTTDDTTDDTTEGHQTDTNNKNKNVKNDKNISTNVDAAEPQKFGNEDINKILEAIKLKVCLDDFRESKPQQRIWGNNLFRLMEKIGPQEFSRRLDIIIRDSFKQKNCNGLQYIYKEIKAFVEPVSRIAIIS